MTAANQPTAHPTLSALYRDHHGWLAGWLRRRLGSAHDAADLSHDTYERLMVSGRLPEAGQARAFLTQIAKGLVIDLFRRRTLETAYLDALAHLPAPHMPSAETRALALETLMAVDAALDALPARARQVFILSRFEGLTYSEIAAQLGVSVALVRKHMLRAAQACLATLWRPAPHIPEPILAQGLEWLVVMWSGEATADERAAWQRWRNAHPDHERAWQQTQRLDARLLGVSPEASAQALAQSARQAGRRKALRLMGWGLAGGGAIGLATGRLPWATDATDYRTAVGERRKVVLEDDTRFTLDSDSAVDVQYSTGARRLALRRGELYVATGHGALAGGRPFSVATEYGNVLALGTRYSVEIQRDRMRVGVYEGVVEIQPRQGTALRLQAGQTAGFTADAAALLPTAPAVAPAWLRGQLVADRLRLADFLDQVGRYRHGVIRCDPRVADLIVSGVYPLADTDRILASLAAALPVQVSRYTGYWVVVEPKNPGPP